MTRTRLRWFAVLATTIAAVSAAVAALPSAPADPTVTSTPIPDDPRPAPDAAALGDLERLSVDGDVISISGWAVDLDDPTSSEIRLSVDGDFVTTLALTIDRPDIAAAYGVDPTRGFETSITLAAEGAHSLCVFTAPDDDLVACERVANDDHLGVLITERDVMVEIERVRNNGYDVITPCGNQARVSDGTRIHTTQILIDPGHGGSEVAAVGPNGIGEKNLNLDVALRTADALRELGYSVELTRTTDIRLPIAVRAGLANALEPDVFLSLHHNGGATARSSVPGTQVYYQHDDDEARRLGGILYEELFAAASRFPTAWVGNSLDGVSTRLNDSGTDFYGIHRRTPEVTSVITEFLWLSNGPEAALLARDDVRNAEADAIATGIDRWYRSGNGGSGYLAPFVDTFDSGGGGFEGCVDPPLE